MNYIKHLRGFYQRVENDENITAHHISLYMALFQVWNIQRFRKKFDINRQDLMAMSRIGSAHTYARCMKQLNDWGYIEYSPPSNRFSASQVSCARFDTTTGTATGSADDTAGNTAGNTANGAASSTLFINNTNYTKGKRNPPNFFDNEKRKKEKIKNPYHVAIDKDYSEPL